MVTIREQTGADSARKARNFGFRGRGRSPAARDPAKRPGISPSLTSTVSPRVGARTPSPKMSAFPSHRTAKIPACGRHICGHRAKKRRVEAARVGVRRRAPPAVPYVVRAPAEDDGGAPRRGPPPWSSACLDRFDLCPRLRARQHIITPNATVFLPPGAFRSARRGAARPVTERET